MRIRPIAALAAVGLSTLVLAGCSSVSMLDDAKLQDEISGQLAEQLGGEWTVTCPDDQEVKTGATFTCDVTAADGTSGQVKVTQDDDQGNISWETIGE